MATEPAHPSIAPGDHKAYMSYALTRARLSPPSPSKFCVGAVLLDATNNKILSTGYSLELPDDCPSDPGKPHAEQCCFIKIAQQHNLPEKRIHEVLPPNTVLYTTMEPCNQRLSGNKPCVDRILRLKKSIKTVFIGIKEPENFIDQCVLVVGRKRLEEAGIEVRFIEGMEEEILKVSLAGH